MDGLIDQHLAYCGMRNFQPSYIAALELTLRRVERTLGPLETIKADALTAWWNDLGVAPSTRIVYLSHLSSFYRWCAREDIRADDPTMRLVRPRVHRRYPRPIRDDQLEQALYHAPEPIHTWLLMAAFMGLRAGEIAGLSREDFQGGRLVVTGKGSKQRILPVHPLIEKQLVRLPQRGYLFPSRRNGHIKSNSLSQRCGRYLRSVGVDASLHQLRHYFGTSVYRRSHDLRLTQELMGHSDPKTTAGYAAWDEDRATAVVEALRLPEFQPDFDPGEN
jgi:integrase/recombinase XerC